LAPNHCIFERAVPPAFSVIIRLDRTVRIKMESVQNARRAVFFLYFRKKCETRRFLSKKRPKGKAPKEKAHQGNRSGMGRFVDIFDSEWKRPHGTPFHRPSSSMIINDVFHGRTSGQEGEREEQKRVVDGIEWPRPAGHDAARSCRVEWGSY
jgi:hypothetical protein